MCRKMVACTNPSPCSPGDFATFKQRMLIRNIKSSEVTDFFFSSKPKKRLDFKQNSTFLVYFSIISDFFVYHYCGGGARHER